MFFTLCVASMLAYSLQGTLMAGLYRRLDSQEAISIRGLCLALIMMSLLPAVPAEAFARLPHYIGGILLAAALASLGAWCNARAFRYLPVGLTIAFISSFNTLLICLWGFLAFGETLNGKQLLIIGAILGCIMGLGISRSAVTLGRVAHPRLGILLCMIYGVFISLAFTLLSYIARELNPLLAAYCWESLIGVVSFLITVVRKTIRRQPILSVTPRDCLKILLFCSPTLVGTGAYMLAVTMGPVSIVAAVNTAVIVVSTVLARVFFKEKAGALQWSLLAGICLLLVALHLAS